MRSMTGCGSGKVQQDGWEVTVDLKTVNHRFLDIGMRLPRNLSFLEQTVRDGLGKKISRGHADVFLTVKRTDASAADVVCDEELAGRYLEAAEQIARKTGVVNDLTVSRLMKMEGVLTLNEREMDEELVAAICAEATEIAAAQLVQMREREGAHLKEDLTVHLDAADALRTLILKRAPAVVDEYREKLETRLKNLLTESVEPQRLAQEVAIIADRCAIDEELARLDSHIRQMRKYLDNENEIGKKMDFLIQEMNREANTIGSKASDAAIAQYVVDLKSEIEKLREQIQNVE
ncbi:MAG: YicC family protein [Clostridia bacterium]|nr:YicC family protein [Clostridia bacterium]